MPFDPNQPQNGELIDAVQLRDQFNALKALLDAQAARTAAGRLAADWTSTTGSFADVTGLAWAVAAGESWSAELVLAAVSGASGQGLKFRVAGPGAAAVLVTIQGTGSIGSGTSECEVQTVFSLASPAKVFCAGASQTGAVRVHVMVVNASAAGSVQLQASNSSGSGTVTIKAHSDLLARRV